MQDLMMAIEKCGMLIEPEYDMKTTEAKTIISKSGTKMEIAGNCYLYGYAKGSHCTETKKIPVYNLKQMTDDEWNALAARNREERKVSA